MSWTGNPLLTIWLRPRETIRRIVDSDPEYRVFVLTWFSGVALAFFDVVSRSGANGLVLMVALAAILIGGPVRAFVGLYLGAALLSWIGRRLGGAASPSEVRAAIAWSNLPVALGCLGVVVFIAAGGVDLLEGGSVGLVDDGRLAFLFQALQLAMVFLYAWSGLLLAFCLGAVQRFSLWKAIMSMAGVWVVLLLPLLSVFGAGWLLTMTARMVGADLLSALPVL